MKVEVYADNRGPGRPLVWPFAYMEIGESMFFPGKTPNHVSSRTWEHKPRKFRSRSMVVNGIPGVMVWRIA